MTTLKNNFFGGINQQVDGHKIDLNAEYYLLTNARVRDNVVEPVPAPLDVTAGLPASGLIQGLYTFDDYLLVFKGGAAYYRLAQDNVWHHIASIALDPNVEYIECCLVPASTVNFKRASVDAADAKSDQLYFSSTQSTPECVFVTDGINQPWVIFPDGSARVTKTYAQWTPDDAEYVPICKHPTFSNGILYCVGRDKAGRFNQIFRSVPGRPLDFVILLDAAGNKVGGEDEGGAPALAWRVSYGECTCLQAVPAQNGAIFAATANASWLVQPDFTNTIAGAPSFVNIPLFDVGASSQFSLVNVRGDTAIVNYDGIRTFNSIMTQQNRGENAPFNIKINRLIDDIKQASAACIEYDDYAGFAVQTIHGPGILWYDTQLQVFVALDLYKNVGKIKQFAKVVTQNNDRLFFFDENGKLFEAFAGNSQRVALYLGEYATSRVRTQHRIAQVSLNFLRARSNGYAQVTAFTDWLRNGTVVRNIVATDAPDDGDFPLDQARTRPDVNNPEFSFADSGVSGYRAGVLIEWDADAVLGAVEVTLDETSIPNPVPDYDGAQTNNISKVVFVGDDGQINSNRTAINRAIKLENPDLVVGCGDHAYNNGTVSEVGNNLAAYWETLRAAGKFVAVPGNHDLDTTAGIAFFDWMRRGRYSSIVIGNAEIFLFNSGFNTAGTQVEPFMLDGLSPTDYVTSTQGKWLQNGLASSTAKHKIVVWHHPPNSSSASYGGGAGIKTAMASLPIRSWGADALICGHSHHYERLENSNGLLHLVNGAGGAPLYDFGTIDAFSQVRIKQFGYVLATITPLHVLFEFKNVNGEVLDRIQI